MVIPVLLNLILIPFPCFVPVEVRGVFLANDLGKWWGIGNTDCFVMTVVRFLAVQEQERTSFGKNM